MHETKSKENDEYGVNINTYLMYKIVIIWN